MLSTHTFRAVTWRMAKGNVYDFKRVFNFNVTHWVTRRVCTATHRKRQIILLTLQTERSFKTKKNEKYISNSILIIHTQVHDTKITRGRIYTLHRLGKMKYYL